MMKARQQRSQQNGNNADEEEEEEEEGMEGGPRGGKKLLVRGDDGAGNAGDGNEEEGLDDNGDAQDDGAAAVGGGGDFTIHVGDNEKIPERQHTIAQVVDEHPADAISEDDGHDIGENVSLISRQPTMMVASPVHSPLPSSDDDGDDEYMFEGGGGAEKRPTIAQVVDEHPAEAIDTGDDNSPTRIFKQPTMMVATPMHLP